MDIFIKDSRVKIQAYKSYKKRKKPVCMTDHSHHIYLFPSFGVFRDNLECYRTFVLILIRRTSLVVFDGQ